MHMHVDRVVYDFACCTPSELVQEAVAALRGRHADSIAVVAHGQPGELQLLGSPTAPTSPTTPTPKSSFKRIFSPDSPSPAPALSTTDRRPSKESTRSAKEHQGAKDTRSPKEARRPSKESRASKEARSSTKEARTSKESRSSANGAKGKGMNGVHERSGSQGMNGGEVGDTGQVEVTITPQTLESDPVVRECVHGLSALLVKGGRMDFLATAAAGGAEGRALFSSLQRVCGTEVVLTSHVGDASASVGSRRAVSATRAPVPDDDGGVTHGAKDVGAVYAQYFNLASLRRWVGPYQQTLAEYDRVRTVGRGAFGSAVLYRKRDDGNYVILKSVDLHTLTVKERQLALNEHVVLGMLDHPNIIK